MLKILSSLLYSDLFVTKELRFNEKSQIENTGAEKAKLEIPSSTVVDRGKCIQTVI
jgi:hypothetical protein